MNQNELKILKFFEIANPDQTVFMGRVLHRCEKFYFVECYDDFHLDGYAVVDRGSVEIAIEIDSFYNSVAFSLRSQKNIPAPDWMRSIQDVISHLEETEEFFSVEWLIDEDYRVVRFQHDPDHSSKIIQQIDGNGELSRWPKYDLHNVSVMRVSQRYERAIDHFIRRRQGSE
jgi:hypothetical protein